MDLSFNLAPSYRDLKDPTSRQNFEDTPGQIPKLILTLRHNLYKGQQYLFLHFLTIKAVLALVPVCVPVPGISSY